MSTSGVPAHERLVAAIRGALAVAADPGRAVQQRAYMKSAMPYRGVRTDAVRRIVGIELDRPEHGLDDRRQWEAAILGLWDPAAYREERYAAIAIARHRLSRRFRADGVRRWAHDPDLWVRRAAILSQIGARQRIDLDLLGDAIEPNLEGSRFADRAGRQDFFIRKAIGWALRDAARHRPEWVRAYVGAHRERLAGLTVREAFRHLGDR